jgi:hypothetical protein
LFVREVLGPEVLGPFDLSQRVGRVSLAKGRQLGH